MATKASEEEIMLPLFDEHMRFSNNIIHLKPLESWEFHWKLRWMKYHGSFATWITWEFRNEVLWVGLQHFILIPWVWTLSNLLYSQWIFSTRKINQKRNLIHFYRSQHIFLIEWLRTGKFELWIKMKVSATWQRIYYFVSLNPLCW